MKTIGFGVCLSAIFFAFCLPLDAEEQTAKAKREQFLNEQVEKLLHLYRQGRREDALKQLEHSFVEAEKRYLSSSLHSRIWKEAQIKTGETDEDWGLDLYLFLLKRDQRNAEGGVARLDDGGYIIHGNIASTLRSLGRVSQAREITSHQQHSLLHHDHLDTVRIPYKDLGPIFSFLPDARNRAFPYRYGHVDPDSKYKHSFISYPRLYAVGDIAGSALDVGDWVRAAELNRWFTNYADQYCVNRRYHRRGEVSRNALDAHSQLARICVMHGYPEHALAEYDLFLKSTEQEGYPVYAVFRHYAKLMKLIIQSGNGSLPEDALEISKQALESIDAYTYYSRGTKLKCHAGAAKIDHALGDREKAWTTLDAMLEKAKVDVNPHHQLKLYRVMKDLAMREGARHPELEAWLIRLLHHERSMGNKFNELPLYEDYAEFLRVNGRLDEAARILQEALRLSVAMNIPKRERKNREALASLRNQIAETRGTGRQIVEQGNESHQPPQRQPSSHAAEEPEKDSKTFIGHAMLDKVDIQPLTSLTVALPETEAYGRFYLTNPTLNDKQGEIQLKGPIVKYEWKKDSVLFVTTRSGHSLQTLNQTLRLSPGANCVVDIKAEAVMDDQEGELICSWVEEGEPLASSKWVWKSSSAHSSTRVIDAHELVTNPFYLIPIHHIIQRPVDEESQKQVDFKIEASADMRIEVYDEASNQLICVDANGDGDFNDKGDLVHQDLNGNHWPDFAFPDGETRAAIVMYVVPGNGEKKERELSISILDKGGWRQDAVDLIR
ncbi:hypothetical protein HW115_10200 [Verrucomicrobiaceae bacterium N1E253]|uniref:Tetratricopeptide repeat protein n=1 Tax=Oceaniferula marina TaxID=2748318 RepID=A0A851GLD4_9BACT|nr:hypothetical protein [Oceaniferula marina]NWK55985.1 hypothetical protein [Oceaniferula marina]